MVLSSPWTATWFSLASVFLMASTALSDSRPAVAERDAKPDKFWVFVGTYTDGGSKGIYRCEFDATTGKLSPCELAAETANPTFLAFHPNHRFLYAVSEIGDFKGKKTGAIRAYALDPKSGALTFLNEQPSGGGGPCHVIVDKEGKHVLAANYGGGSACVLPIDKEGRLGEATAVVQHEGRSANPARQEGPHAHSINLDAANRFAVVADLGLDKVFVYKYDADKGTLTKNDPASVSLAPGSGPRHFAFHPDGHHAYVINELKSTVTAFEYDAERGALKELQTIGTLPEDYKGETTTAEVQLHPSGKFVYGSNRGQNSIAVFTVDEKTGKLTAAGRQGKDVKVPRNFRIDPSGTFMIVGNQDGKSLIVFRIDPKTGALTPTGTTVEVPSPVCVQMMPVGG